MARLSHLGFGGGRKGVSRPISTPAPVLGLNKRDSIFSLLPGFATIMTNWYPNQGTVSIRKGFRSINDDVMAGGVKTLAVYRSGTTSRLLACGGGEIRDVTIAETPAVLSSGNTSDEWQTINFKGRLFFVNGVDPPKVYDGLTVEDATFTGPTNINSLVGVASWANRLIFFEKDSAHIWYGGLNFIQGPLELFAMDGVVPSGGNITAVGNITHDGGQGPANIIAVCFDSGAVALYSGYNIHADISLVGTYEIGRVLGMRSMVKIGGDLAVITSDGLIALNQFLKQQAAETALSISDIIRDKMNDYVSRYGGNFGWQPVMYVDGGYLLVNIPGMPSRQFVMNLTTKAWAEFVGMDAYCWAVFDDKIYFGGRDGKVYRANYGYSDELDGEAIPIEAKFQTAFNYFHRGTGLVKFASEKHFRAYRAIMQSNGTPEVLNVGIGTDYTNRIDLEPISIVQDSSDAVWDESMWDAVQWGNPVNIVSDWRDTGASGTCAAFQVEARSKGLIIEAIAFDAIFEETSTPSL